MTRRSTTRSFGWRRTSPCGYPLVDGQGNFGVDRRRLAGGHALHGGAHGEARVGAARRHRQGDDRLGEELRREGGRAHRSPDEGAQPAAQRRGGHRGGDGDQHPAPQPHRAHRRLPGADRRPGPRYSGPARVRQGGRTSPPAARSSAAPGSWPPTPAAAAASRFGHAARSTRTRRAARRSSSPRSRTRSTRCASSSASRSSSATSGLEGISDVQDYSDRTGMRIWIQIKRDAAAQVVLNNLYKMTDLQTSFGVNMIAISGGRPQVLTLKDALSAFIDHRRTVVIRRTRYELRKAIERREIVEGLGVAVDAIDRVIAIIRGVAGPGDRPGAADGGAAHRLRRVPRALRASGRRGRGGQAGPVSALGAASAGDPRDAAAAADRSRAGEDRGGVQGAVRGDRATAGDPRGQRAAHEGDPRGARGGPQRVRRPHRPGRGRRRPRIPRVTAHADSSRRRGRSSRSTSSPTTRWS